VVICQPVSSVNQQCYKHRAGVTKSARMARVALVTSRCERRSGGAFGSVLTGQVSDEEVDRVPTCTSKRSLKRRKWRAPDLLRSRRAMRAVPLALPGRCIEVSTAPNEIVLDTFVEGGPAITRRRLG
jgi:hypothetical protein